MKILVDARIDDLGNEASVEASSISLRVGAFPPTVEYRGRNYSHPWRMVSKFGDLQGIRYRTDDALYIFTIFND